MYPPEQILPSRLPLFNSLSEPISNSSSRFEELHQLASSTFYFPNSPYSSLQYNEDHFFNELTWEQLQPFPSLTDQIQTAMQNPCEDPIMPQNNAAKKRPMKKDRHSKITTAKGPRDRRMRLSLDVARKFFDLQDVLGYDKASKTVEWLLIQANTAIEEVSQGYNNPLTTTTTASISSTQSECEVVSGIDDATTTAAVKKGGKRKAKAVAAKRTRESRKEARERARERTLARKSTNIAGVDPKQCLEWGQLCGSVEDKEVEDHRRRYGDGDDISVITRNWNPSCIYQQDAAPQISHVNDDLTEFGYCGKAWEAYNSI